MTPRMVVTVPYIIYSTRARQYWGNEAETYEVVVVADRVSHEEPFKVEMKDE
jgi:hypothetical protein